MLSLFALSLLTIGPQSDPSFDARVKQLSLDRREAFSLSACLNGKFTYYGDELGLGDKQFSVIYFPAGRADRLFVSSEWGYGEKGKDFAASYEVREGRARRLWAVDRPLALKGGRFSIRQPVERIQPALRGDLAHHWALASYPSGDMMRNAPRLFDDELGVHGEDKFNTAEPYPVSAAERAWLQKHGFPSSNSVREPASEMRKWEDLADLLRKDRQRLARACSKPTDKDLYTLPSFFFPIGRSDTVIVTRPISDRVRDVSSYSSDKGRARLRWQFRMREPRPEDDEDRALILSCRSPSNLSRGIRRDLRSSSGFVEYIGVEESHMGRIVGASGEIADYAQQRMTPPFETKPDEITYLRANRPWPSARRK